MRPSHLWLLTALVAPAAAQGSAADYERAATLGRRVERAVRGLDLAYRWSPAGDRLWFERLGSDGATAAFEYDTARGELLPSAPLDALGADSPFALQLEPARANARTRRDGARVAVTFVNATEGPLETFWLDQEGALRSYGTLAPGERRAQGTVAGHRWRFRAAGGDALGDLVAPDSGGIVFVRGAASQSQSQSQGQGQGRTQPPRRAPRAESPPRGAAAEAAARVEVRGADAWLVRDDGERRLTEDGAEGAAYCGPLISAPDGGAIVFFHEQRGAGREVTLVEAAPREGLQPRTLTFGYDKPGDALTVRTLRVVDVASGAVHGLPPDLCTHPWELRDVRWTPDGARLHCVVIERGHRIVRLVELDPRSGATRAVIDEQPATFFDYAHKLFVHHLDATDEVLWLSERSGWNHLWRIERRSGVAVPVTQGEWVVRRVDEIDEERREALIRVMGRAPGQDPYHVHFARVHLDTGAITELTDGDGTHTLERSPDGAHYVATWQRVDQPPVRELRRWSDGEKLLELSRPDTSRVSEALPRPPQRFVAKGRDGVTDIHGVLHWPSNFEPGRTYPVVEAIYAGPHGAHVPKTFDLDREPQRLAELGFVVGQIDGMGTNWRSKAFHDVAWKDLADAGFPDRILWWRAAAAAHPELDLTRVGIYGGSAGGQNALRAVLDHADFYRAAAADCGCHDNRMDKVWWNELWMGWPVDDAYLASSNVEHAHRLGGKLLLTVGALDRNVDPSSTLQVVEALIRADKDFELIVFPSGGHGIGESPYGKRRRDDFFVRHLLGVEPRWKP